MLKYAARRAECRTFSVPVTVQLCSGLAWRAMEILWWFSNNHAGTIFEQMGVVRFELVRHSRCVSSAMLVFRLG